MYPVTVTYDSGRIPPPKNWKAIPDEDCWNALLCELKCSVAKIALDHNGRYSDQHLELACPGSSGKFCFEVKIRAVRADTEGGVNYLARAGYTEIALGQWYFQATIVEEPTPCK